MQRQSVCVGGGGTRKRQQDGITYESEREKVKKNKESDGTKGSCVLDGSQVCLTDGNLKPGRHCLA